MAGSFGGFSSLAGAPQGLQMAYMRDPRLRLAQQLQLQGADASPVQHWTQGAARLAQALAGNFVQDRADGEYKKQADQYQSDIGALYAPVMQPGAGGAGPRPDAQMRAPNVNELQQRMASMQSPYALEAARPMLQSAMQQQAEGQRFERDLAARREDTAAQREFAAQQARENLAFRGQESQASREQARALADLQRRTSLEAAQLRAGNRVDPLIQVADPTDPTRGVYVPQSQAAGRQAPKPQARAENLPAAALKLQNEAVEQIGTTANINADLGRFAEMIDSGKLDFGPVTNLMNRGRNMTGRATEQSANFASFESSLERLRNESLRLNSGVQTDGDAQRAWNELINNINDPRIVKQRLQEIQRLNERAATLKQNQVDLTRANFGLPPLDTSQFRNVAPAVGGGAPAARGPQPGAVEDGYRFKGGAPNDPNNWEKVQ